MRRLPAWLALLVSLTACVVEPVGAPDEDEDAIDLGDGRGDQNLVFNVTLSPLHPTRLLSFTSVAPRSRVAVTFEMSPADQELLKQQPRRVLDPVSAEELRLTEEVVALRAGLEREEPTVYDIQRGVYWGFREDLESFRSTWFGPDLTDDHFAVRLFRNLDLPADAFPELKVRARVYIKEWDPDNVCYGRPNGQQECCYQEGAGVDWSGRPIREASICSCQGGLVRRIEGCGIINHSYASGNPNVGLHVWQESFSCGLPSGATDWEGTGRRACYPPGLD